MRTLLVVTLAMTSSCLAQTFGFGVTLSNDFLAEPDISLTNLAFSEGRLSVRLAGGVSGPLELGLSTRQTRSFGPLGNLLLLTRGDVSAEGFDFQFAAEGVIATVAAKARLSLFSADPGTFDLAEAFSASARPPLSAVPAFGSALDLTATYRWNRTLILSAEPSLYGYDGEGVGGRLGLNARLARIVGRDDVQLLALGYLAPGDAPSYAALGAAYDLNRRNWPDLLVSAWVGLGESGFAPGGRLELSQSLPPGASYALTLGAEPYRSDALPYRATLRYTQALGPGDLETSLFGTLTPGEPQPGSQPGSLSVRLRYEVPF